jgi:NADP-dependent 3-hydroxy acid dehydrogenase YdfG
MRDLKEKTIPGGCSSEDGLRDWVSVITGASSGIGRAIALALSRLGGHLCLFGRDGDQLAETAAAVRRCCQATEFLIDWTVQGDLNPVIRHMQALGRLDILVHCAGAIRLSPMEGARIEDLDHQYAINVRAPYTLTQRLLPFLKLAHGQVVFVNSSAGLTANRLATGQYAATKHALKAVADSLRQEVNPKGIRVLSLYLGRVATPMQETLYRQQGAVYEPDKLLQPEDVASFIVQVLLLPPTAEVTEISMRPMQKTY